MSEYFKLPPYNDDQPLVEHPFYKWLTDNVDRSQGGHSKMLDWIKGLGFRVGEDALAPEDVDTLHLVEEHWWRCSPWYEPHTDKDLFVKPLLVVRASTYRALPTTSSWALHTSCRPWF